jgi:hypothetical protein
MHSSLAVAIRPVRTRPIAPFVAGAVARGRASLEAFVALPTDLRGRLGIDELCNIARSCSACPQEHCPDTPTADNAPRSRFAPESRPRSRPTVGVVSRHSNGDGNGTLNRRNASVSAVWRQDCQRRLKTDPFATLGF